MLSHFPKATQSVSEPGFVPGTPVPEPALETALLLSYSLQGCDGWNTWEKEDL